jgi:hypothetical protein
MTTNRTRIDHRNHDHPNTKRARELCRQGLVQPNQAPPYIPALELVWRPAPGVERVVVEVPLETLEQALRNPAL